MAAIEQSARSIFDLIPEEQGGRIARQGFSYQDHVGAKFCLDMYRGGNISEIWFESFDDLTIIREVYGETIVEMVQVKAEKPSSLWSIAALCKQNKSTITNQEKSIIEKSLLRARCNEKTIFRIVVMHEVARDVAPITTPLADHSCRECSDELDNLVEIIEKKIGHIVSESGLELKDWAYNAFLDKQPDSIHTIEACNLRLLEDILHEKQLYAGSDHRDELYLSLLVWIKELSELEIAGDYNRIKMKRNDLERWFRERIEGLEISPGSDRMAEKMRAAGIPQDYIESAKTIRQQYVVHALNYDYISKSTLSRVEASVSSILSKDRLKLDTGEIQDNGPQFLLRCINDLNEQIDVLYVGGSKPPESILTGCMYNQANRCVHRFKAAES